MNRSGYYNYIDEKLHVLSVRVESRGKLNVLDFHLHSENFYMYLLNLLYGWKLNNMNSRIQNVEAIDLIDNDHKLIIQVSATTTKQKIESTLEKDMFKKYPDYCFKFLSVSKDADDLRKKTYKNPHNVIFNPQNDIIDISSALRTIISFEIDKQKETYEFIKKELGLDLDAVKLDSDLATIIGILSKENLTTLDPINNINSYEIDKKIKHNELNAVKLIIEDYKIYYNKLDKKYKEFDKLGANRSLVVLQSIRQQYIKAICENEYRNKDILFLSVIEQVKAQVVSSKNYKGMPFEELDFCVNILVVDAFIRCKIFENPEEYNYVATR